MEMDVTKEMIIRFFTKFCQMMNDRGDAVVEDVGNALDYDRSSTYAIERELRRTQKGREGDAA